ncbi:hypothetical protein EVAR_44539_1 [Eumeta japonica]|uniref:Uncharacterized protein n=1 Tax=Eumeta variegata TaxID=151549 RepID=A0A4C1X9N3_EUMVA|nr:hypothetical protein EVAR_44539_1 [Eumeta japonica]
MNVRPNDHRVVLESDSNESDADHLRAFLTESSTSFNEVPFVPCQGRDSRSPCAPKPLIRPVCTHCCLNPAPADGDRCRHVARGDLIAGRSTTLNPDAVGKLRAGCAGRGARGGALNIPGPAGAPPALATSPILTLNPFCDPQGSRRALLLRRKRSTSSRARRGGGRRTSTLR